MSLKGKHALITGSSRGIGRGIALKLAENGVKVAIHYYQNTAGAGSHQELAWARLDADGTLGNAKDVGNAVALFCAEEAGWITGQVIYADGGASLMNPEVPPEIQLG